MSKELHYRNVGDGSEKRDYDEAIEALRRAVCRLQQYEFWLNSTNNGVVRVPSRHGGWISFQELHELFDTEMIDSLIAGERAKAAIDDAKEST